ncbi:hypothetical protein [Nitrospirillum sp. BR 11828]|uniref:hypothetical protein n=1 Tax=Nitrospirillum sp. BR 11828 TaxID=3104325 RepID=UPI002ACA8E7A|nr:hypothetical protein [Nitrospirillum sp. BR 11828]MDZ5648976.1 hypothetical protein [Nitrospirillum sp. BR 11828]
MKLQAAALLTLTLIVGAGMADRALAWPPDLLPADALPLKAALRADPPPAQHPPVAAVQQAAPQGGVDRDIPAPRVAPATCSRWVDEDAGASLGRQPAFARLDALDQHRGHPVIPWWPQSALTSGSWSAPF